MARIFLDVQVPGNARSYEFAADDRMSVGRVKAQFIQQISAVENRAIFADPGEVLFCSTRLEGLLQEHEVLREIGVISGDTIILL